jgi:hypothetical protein
MKLFRQLTDIEAKDFQAWARANYHPHSQISGVWHPVIQAECVKMNEEQDLPVAFDWGDNK